MHRGSLKIDYSPFLHDSLQADSSVRICHSNSDAVTSELCPVSACGGDAVESELRIEGTGRAVKAANVVAQ